VVFTVELEVSSKPSHSFKMTLCNLSIEAFRVFTHISFVYIEILTEIIRAI
jgi:hypothetical protein